MPLLFRLGSRGRTGIGLCISVVSTDDEEDESDRSGGLGFVDVGSLLIVNEVGMPNIPCWSEPSK